MIKNERQYAVTRSRVRDFERSLSALDDGLRQDGGLPDNLGRDALRGQLEDLRGEVAEYERLRAGDTAAAPYDLEDLPRTLIKRRISLGMGVREVAERLGLEEQRVREYERTDYEGADYDTMMGALTVLSVEGDEKVVRGKAADFEGALERLSSVGLDREFAGRHILYEPGASLRRGALREQSKPRLLARLGALFGWTSEQVLGGGPPELGSVAPDAGGRAADPRSRSHVAYARGMAGILARAVQSSKAPRGRAGPHGAQGTAKPPDSAPFARLVGRAWDSGVPVMRLGPLAFRSACLREGGLAVAVLSGSGASETDPSLDLLRAMHCARTGSECVLSGRGAPGGIGGDLADELADAVLSGAADGNPEWLSGYLRGIADGLEYGRLEHAHRRGRTAPIQSPQGAVRSWPAVVSNAALEVIDLSALDGPALALLTGAIRAGYAREPPVGGA